MMGVNYMMLATGLAARLAVAAERLLPSGRCLGGGLTLREARRAAVAIHGRGTKVRVWADGSGHILPPPPYREEEALYSFHDGPALKRLLGDRMSG